MIPSDSIPWQAAYDRFRQVYPTGGLLFDLVATPTPPQNQYVVKALAQIGNVPFLSVLAEASDLAMAETCACTKLCQVLGLLTAPPTPAKTFPETPPAPELTELKRSSPPLPESLSPSLPEPFSSVPVTLPSKLQPPSPFQSVPLPPVHPSLNPHSSDTSEEDWSEELAQIDAEVRRLGWTAAQESAYLHEHHGKASRDHLTDYGELLEFLTALQTLPSPLRDPKSQTAYVASPDRYNPSSQISLDPLHLDSENNADQVVLPLEVIRVNMPNSSILSRDDMMEQVMAEIQRIGWGKKQGSDYLLKTYGLKTRQELNDGQLREFLNYLQHQPVK